MKLIAAMHTSDGPLFNYLTGLKVNREEWDSNRGGGHFWFEPTGGKAGVELVDAFADDLDGAPICITLHLIGSDADWAEWYRLDCEPVRRWPPTSVRSTVT
ncbi:MAG: hypothetical protein JO193_07160 [Candidatus Eremiobacteraeota bacterium]|nr:hypothetical protein [Candidatus Eremiobacteraeota bacterium]